MQATWYKYKCHCKNLKTSKQRIPIHQTLAGRCYSSENACKSDDENERLYGKWELPDIDLDWDYLSDPGNRDAIKMNILNRKGVGNINKLKKDKSDVERELYETAIELPNQTHPAVSIDPNSEGTLLENVGKQREFDFKPRSVVELGEHLGILRTSNVKLTTGPRTYYFRGALAMMEQALIKYTIDSLKQQGFKMMSVPDLLYPEIIERCGFKTTGERNQVYRLEPNKYGHVCLAGTGEMPLAAFCMGHGFAWEELPQKLMTVTRCYRAETSTVEEEQGIYRVHQFTKVEMFVVTGQEHQTDSQKMMDLMLDVQKQLFTPLGLYMRILDMPAHDLGAPAYRKYDIEAWMPAKEFWGEISSTSNCTDYQSRRLDIRYWNNDGNLKHCHTLNGTACAVPRLIMGILETHQQKDKTVSIPEVLQPYMDGVKILKPDNRTVMKPIRYSKGIMKHIRSA
ncbi:hypothetical protein LSH36_685g01023 [Paralvinella palmiformis]|uniref:serine--tRNA ligase n=1 Tax=Paralvinella palmiformis TaxID=53620 RepID=A0AAD9J2D1_9ANNE|nr:hypothetical protein LSH36_685g01023 [Paralvinella palmiformis]